MVVMGLAKMKQIIQMEMIYHTGDCNFYTDMCHLKVDFNHGLGSVRVTITNVCLSKFEA